MLMTGLYTFAAKHRGLSSTNPVEGIELFAENQCERIVEPSEVRQLLKALGKDQSECCDVFLIGLLTGARRRNVLAPNRSGGQSSFLSSGGDQQLRTAL